VSFELDYNKKYFNNVPAWRFAEAVRAEGIPIAGGERGYSRGCHKEEMLEESLNSQVFRASFSKARLKKYRESSHLPIIGNIRRSGKGKLSIEGEIAFLGPRKDIDDIVEAFAKVTGSVGELT